MKAKEFILAVSSSRIEDYFLSLKCELNEKDEKDRKEMIELRDKMIGPEKKIEESKQE